MRRGAVSPVVWALLRGLLAAVVMATGLSACASLPEPQPRPTTTAWPAPQDTLLGRVASAGAPNARYSGFKLVASGEEALGTLVALADHAERTLDLQYYLIHPDASTRAIFARVLAAADRGVRVRVLLDDMHTAGSDAALLRLAAHRNVEVRLYNPFPAGRASTITRVMASLTDIARINHRMHNKMFVADNALALTGGRNLGDAYFLRSSDTNFLDLDALVAGPVVRQLSAAFDRYWNSSHAWPIEELAQRGSQPAAAPAPPAASAFAPDDRGTPVSKGQHASADLKDAVAGRSSQPLPQPRRDAPSSQPSPEVVATVPRVDLPAQIRAGRLPLTWAPATVIVDKPSKIASEGNPDQDETLADDVGEIAKAAQTELVLISPYFVPGKRGVALLRGLRERGVVIRILTNSLAATDAAAVHTGYARYREDLLRMGVELHELRARPGGGMRTKWGGSSGSGSGSSSASLHVKSMVIDGRTLLVGSMNLDPRSAYLNTELMLAMRSRELSQRVIQLYQEAARTGSWRVTWETGPGLVWTAPDGQRVTTEPDAPLWLRALIKVLGPIAPEELL